MSGFSQSFRAAFKSFWSCIALMASAVSALNVLRQMYQLNFGQIVEAIIAQYRAIFHPIVEFLFAWLPWKTPPIFDDVALLYLTLGAALARTMMVFFMAYREYDRSPQHLHERVLLLGTYLLNSVLWPVYLTRLFMLPILYTYRITPNQDWPELGAASERRSKLELGTFVADARIVFLLQLTAVVCVVAVIVAAGLFGIV